MPAPRTNPRPGPIDWPRYRPGLKVEEAAEIIGISPSFCRRLARAGEIPCKTLRSEHPRARPRYVVPRDLLRAWLEGQGR